MIDSSDNSLTFSAKLDRLFDVCRSRDQSEQSLEVVARSVSEIIGRPVTGSEVGALRCQGSANPEPGIICGLAKHFGVPATYLTSTGPQAEHVDKQLRLLAAARDAGVRRLRLRGGAAIGNSNNMFEVLHKLPLENL